MNQLRYIWVRLKGIWIERGPNGFFRFLLGRLIRRTEDLVFEKPLAHLDDQPEETDLNDRFFTIDRYCFDGHTERKILAQILVGENELYAQGLRENDYLFVATDTNGDVLHYSFVQFKSRYKTIIGEDQLVPMFTNCWTAPQARGQRLYPSTLSKGAAILKKAGHDRVVITCSPENVASVKGIERAGFVRKKHVFNILLLSRLIFQTVKPEGQSSYRRFSYLHES